MVIVGATLAWRLSFTADDPPDTGGGDELGPLHEYERVPPNEGVAWLQSQMPTLQVPSSYRKRGHRGREHQVAVRVPLARRDERDVRIAVFRIPLDAMGWPHGDLVIAIDPRDRPFGTKPDDALLEEIERAGWHCEVHSAWLLLCEKEPGHVRPRDVPKTVDRALAIARRVFSTTPPERVD